MRLIPIIVLILVSVSFSDTATQTDWSGGGGVLGPAKYTVDSDFDGARSVYATNVDGDGYMDVIGAADYADHRSCKYTCA